MVTKYKCDICKKESKRECLVWYTFNMPETNLCRSHYLKWNKHHKLFKESHKNIKPCTEEWSKMCYEESILFMKWFKVQ